MAWIDAQRPEFILSVYFNQLVREPLLSRPGCVSLNIHPSLLPAYRGVDPVFYGLLRSETRLGVTLHLMDQGFDTGNILAQSENPAQPGRSLFWHYMQLFRLGAGMAADEILKAAEGDTGLRQHGTGNYDSWPEKFQVEGFIKAGHRLMEAREYLRVVFGKP